MCSFVSVCVVISIGIEVMCKHRRMSACVVLLAYINISEAVKVSVHTNLTAHIKDQQQWKENYQTVNQKQLCDQKSAPSKWRTIVELESIHFIYSIPRRHFSTLYNEITPLLLGDR